MEEIIKNLKNAMIVYLIYAILTTLSTVYFLVAGNYSMFIGVIVSAIVAWVLYAKIVKNRKNCGIGENIIYEH